jgi:hypothetical protein
MPWGEWLTHDGCYFKDCGGAGKPCDACREDQQPAPDAKVTEALNRSVYGE